MVRAPDPAQVQDSKSASASDRRPSRHGAQVARRRPCSGGPVRDGHPSARDREQQGAPALRSADRRAVQPRAPELDAPPQEPETPHHEGEVGPARQDVAAPRLAPEGAPGTYARADPDRRSRQAQGHAQELRSRSSSGAARSASTSIAARSSRPASASPPSCLSIRRRSAFTIVTMQRHPWWYPPDSDWADGAQPIRPGPGTRSGRAGWASRSAASGSTGRPARPRSGTRRRTATSGWGSLRPSGSSSVRVRDDRLHRRRVRSAKLSPFAKPSIH